MTPSPIESARGRWLRLMALATAVLTVLAALVWLWATAAWPAWGRAIAAATAGLAVAAWGRHVLRAFTPAAVARHLDRTYPEAEESAELLLASDREATGLAALQRRRVHDRLAALDLPPLPRRPVRRLSVPALGVTAAALVVLLAPSSSRSRQPNTAAPPIGPDTTMTVSLERVTVHPPAYLGMPPRDTAAWSLEAPEGSRIEWRLSASPFVEAVTLVTTAGDSVAATCTSPDGSPGGRVSGQRPEGPPRGSCNTSLAAEIVAGHSLLYRVVLEGGDRRWASQYYRVGVDADDAPVIAVSEPGGHQEVLPGTRARMRVTATMADDHGVGDAELVVTLATGAGEGVSFREERRAFDRVRPAGPRRATLEKTFDLAALGMAPGDELYFHIVGRDNRRPVPNTTRSATYLVRLIDTAAVIVSDPQGLAVDRLPEFFRSQRQIIIDTEALLAERGTIDQAEFQRRSQNIGFDQYLLRQRYSQFVGDEFEDAPLVFSEEDRAALGIEGEAEAIDADAIIAAAEAAEEEDLTEAVTHEHDDPENATLLGATVKTTLKSALDAMWRAELYLRTHRPAAALPDEYRALAFLKQVQQSGRAYVLRTGYEPPPLEPADRLTGKLEGVRSRTVRRELAPAQAEAGRRALTVLQRLVTGGDPGIPCANPGAGPGGRVSEPVAAYPPSPAGELQRPEGLPRGLCKPSLEPGELAMLEEARTALTADAASGTVDLAGLAALGRLIDSLGTGAVCDECLEPAAEALASALSPPTPPAAGIRVAEPAVGARYLELLGAEQR